ncbi:HK97 gp10 family phage protein [Enterococcus casseliflavus]|uniref:HK97-gp10 family putative phage morphogenesis protein n=1 Tax=Enterococcus casseliflavus TaxID=37734 RepID=UPI002DBF875A|nr:HK97-gp10 family putative phage morphogenesis protein [Enterococcus casseliflavus]MEB8400913.1 HK97 gp10 family phage protein [Enterococcus casseliflavus]
MGRGFQVKGLQALDQKLARNMQMKEVRQIVRTNGAEMNETAQRKAPVDTSFLRRSITFSMLDNGFSAMSLAGADYGGYVEWGTRFMAAQPYMKPAYIAQKAKFLADMKRLVG